jgi:hypothetical protein
MVHMVEHLPSKLKALIQMPVPTIKEKKHLVTDQDFTLNGLQLETLLVR